MKLISDILKLGAKWYLLASGVLFHLALLWLVVPVAWDKLLGAAPGLKGQFADSAELYEVPASGDGKRNYSTIPSGRWLKIHQMSQDDEVFFARQHHSGSAWDSKRQRLIVFGSDTHGQNWDNGIYAFDMQTLTWTSEYQPDPWETYRADAGGSAVAGSQASPRPWAMHGFDALNYDPLADSLVVASAPSHLKPGRFDNTLVSVWDSVTRHPTWIYSFRLKTWRQAQGNVVDFFPYATAYDSHENRITGFRPYGIHVFLGPEHGWSKIAAKSVYAYETQAVYDSFNRAFVLYGTHDQSDAVHVFRLGDSESRAMPTPGIRPPGGKSSPIAYHEKLAKTVLVVNPNNADGQLATTWLYDLAEDKWKQLEEARFPQRLGMNYHLQYSSQLDLLILFHSRQGEPGSIWVLRL